MSGPCAPATQPRAHRVCSLSLGYPAYCTSPPLCCCKGGDAVAVRGREAGEKLRNEGFEHRSARADDGDVGLDAAPVGCFGAVPGEVVHVSCEDDEGVEAEDGDYADAAKQWLAQTALVCNGMSEDRGDECNYSQPTKSEDYHQCNLLPCGHLKRLDDGQW